MSKRSKRSLRRLRFVVVHGNMRGSQIFGVGMFENLDEEISSGLRRPSSPSMLPNSG